MTPAFQSGGYAAPACPSSAVGLRTSWIVDGSLGITNRRYPNDEEVDVGYNGHANFSFNGPALHIAYYDLNHSLALTEDWNIDIESGALEGPHLKKVLDDPSLHYREA